jgi:predicted AAA+ superfamily ATPase
MTGSSSLGLLDAAADSLAGRVDIHSLPTACWGEEQGPPRHAIFSGAPSPPEIDEAGRRLDSALEFGQFPEILAATDDDVRHKLLTRYRNSYFTRDLMQLANLQNVEGLLAILHNLSRSIGSHLEVSHFARESGLSHPTAKKYLSALDHSQLTFRLRGYQYGPAKRFIKAAKTYFCDNGVIRSLGIAVTRGQLLENFVVAELEKRRKLGLIECDQLYYYKSAAGREIDVVFECGQVVHAIEIKATANPGPKDLRGLREFRNRMPRDVECSLFYTGTRREEVDGINLIPVAFLLGGR